MAKPPNETKGAMTESALALDRWAGEGGAPAALAGASFEPGRQHLLLRLGIATVAEWERLPTDAQRAIFRRAADDHGETPATMRELARFLHDSTGRRNGGVPRKAANGPSPPA